MIHYISHGFSYPAELIISTSRWSIAEETVCFYSYFTSNTTIQDQTREQSTCLQITSPSKHTKQRQSYHMQYNNNEVWFQSLQKTPKCKQRQCRHATRILTNTSNTILNQMGYKSIVIASIMQIPPSKSQQTHPIYPKNDKMESNWLPTWPFPTDT